MHRIGLSTRPILGLFLAAALCCVGSLSAEQPATDKEEEEKPTPPAAKKSDGDEDGQLVERVAVPAIDDTELLTEFAEIKIDVAKGIVTGEIHLFDLDIPVAIHRDSRFEF